MVSPPELPNYPPHNVLQWSHVFSDMVRGLLKMPAED